MNCLLTIFVHNYYAQPIYYTDISKCYESLTDWSIPLSFFLAHNINTASLSLYWWGQFIYWITWVRASVRVFPMMHCTGRRCWLGTQRGHCLRHLPRKHIAVWHQRRRRDVVHEGDLWPERCWETTFLQSHHHSVQQCLVWRHCGQTERDSTSDGPHCGIWKFLTLTLPLTVVFYLWYPTFARTYC